MSDVQITPQAAEEFSKQIHYIEPATLSPWRRNARKHSGKQLQQIAQSMEEFGFTSPVLIDRHNTILAGHGRVEAAKLLKLKQVPCLYIEHLSEAQKRAYVLADNKIALSMPHGMRICFPRN